MPKKPTSIRITKVRVTRKQIFISYHNGDEELTIKSRDNPLPSFTKAVTELVPLILAICHLPPAYGENMRATGFTLTDKGMVTLQAAKSFDDAGSPLNIATPLRFLELPSEEGSYTPPLTEKQADLVVTVEEEAKDYVLGKRAQGQIVFDGDDDDDAEDDDKEDAPGQAVIPLPDQNKGKAVKPKKAKPAKSGE